MFAPLLSMVATLMSSATTSAATRSRLILGETWDSVSGLRPSFWSRWVDGNDFDWVELCLESFFARVRAQRCGEDFRRPFGSILLNMSREENTILTRLTIAVKGWGGLIMWHGWVWDPTSRDASRDELGSFRIISMNKEVIVKGSGF